MVCVCRVCLFVVGVFVVRWFIVACRFCVCVIGSHGFVSEKQGASTRVSLDVARLKLSLSNRHTYKHILHILKYMYIYIYVCIAKNK